MKLLQQSKLFAGLTEEEIVTCLQCGNCETHTYQKGQRIFGESDTPRYLYLLLHGAVDICQEDALGNRFLMRSITQSGASFGEVFLFSAIDQYPCSTIAVKPSSILQLPKSFLVYPCPKRCDFHQKLTRNLLSVMAENANLLQKRVQLLSRSTLRQKLTFYLLQLPREQNVVALPFQREKLAEYLGVARPSLSRELMQMQKEGLLTVQGRHITLESTEKLQQYL